MTARGAAGRCPTTTWLGRVLLLVYLLVSSSIAKEQSKHCSQMIGDGHLQLLQQLIDSQMETSCKISFMFVDQNLTDQVCYIRKAFLLVQDILEDTISFKGNTSNANALKNIQELSVRLNDCFPKVNDEEQDKACVQNFSESPLWLLEKIKNVFSEMKNLLKDNQDIFSKDCSDSFAECSSQGHKQPPTPQPPEPLLPPLASGGGGVILVLLALGGLLFYGWRRRSLREPQRVDSPMERPEGSPLTQDEDRQVDLPV
ncbi:macrophage colony-stimulating factor 1 isoform X3 [Sturnira hondurensis]|uniref:macrophage colony-stimulating factor 1 isoform X3 n=1 Tax=Sturnira hondurensis TaxID=192404 RepID=UPI0018793C04|nr:macrophage colony-stimulating factor 1 isoform X3 [Sturnira hondurensis]